MAFKLNQRVKVEWAGGEEFVTGTIFGSPTLLADGSGLAWPVKLDKGLWSEDHKVYVRILLAHEDGIRDATPRLADPEAVEAFLDRLQLS